MSQFKPRYSDIPCPSCEVPAFEGCVSGQGHAIKGWHQARSDAAWTLQRQPPYRDQNILRSLKKSLHYLKEVKELSSTMDSVRLPYLKGILEVEELIEKAKEGLKNEQ